MTAHLDRFKLLLQPDISPPGFENAPLNRNDKFRSFKILKNEQLRNLDHKTKNTIRLIIELYGNLIPDQFFVKKERLDDTEVCLIHFTDNGKNPLPNPLTGEWINNAFIKCKLPRLALCVYSEIKSKIFIWYITEGCLQSTSKL